MTEVRERDFLSWLATGGTFMIVGISFSKINKIYGAFIVCLGSLLITYSTLRYSGEKHNINPLPIRAFGIIGTILSIGAVIVMIVSPSIKA